MTANALFPSPLLESEDLICSINPLGFSLRQFVELQYLLQALRKHTKQSLLRYIPGVVDFLVSPFVVSLETVCCFLPPLLCRDSQAPVKATSERSYYLPQPSLF